MLATCFRGMAHTGKITVNPNFCSDCSVAKHLNIYDEKIFMESEMKKFYICIKHCRDRVQEKLIINLLGPEMCGSNFTFFILILWIEILSTSGKIGLWRVPQNFIDDMSTMVQEMAWCHQTSSLALYLSQCWPRSMSTFRVTNPL